MLVFVVATCNTDWSSYLALAFDSLFMADVLINFNCAFLDDQDQLIDDHRAIAMRYAR